eukprot:3196042-Pyramimonas_sp.AAC.1
MACPPPPLRRTSGRATSPSAQPTARRSTLAAARGRRWRRTGMAHKADGALNTASLRHTTASP